MDFCLIILYEDWNELEVKEVKNEKIYENHSNFFNSLLLQDYWVNDFGYMIYNQSPDVHFVDNPPNPKSSQSSIVRAIAVIIGLIICSLIPGCTIGDGGEGDEWMDFLLEAFDNLKSVRPEFLIIFCLFLFYAIMDFIDHKKTEKRFKKIEEQLKKRVVKKSLEDGKN